MKIKFVEVSPASILDIPGDRHLIMVEAASGERRIHVRTFEEAQAKRVAARVEAAGEINEEHWVYHYPRYGSVAFEGEEGEAAMYASTIRTGGATEADVPFPANTLL